jgi:elongation factor P
LEGGEENMPLDLGDIRPGLTIEYEGEVYYVLSAEHAKLGRGGAFVRARLRNIKTDAVIDKTIKPGDKFDLAFIERKNLQYIYHTGDEYVFMDPETYEQISLPSSLLSPILPYLKEGVDYQAVIYEGKVIAIEPPITVDLEVVDTEPGVRGDTASGGTKPATLETGLVVQVPLFIERGDIVKIDTRTGEYVERVR